MTTEADNNLEEMINEVCASCGKAAVDGVKLKKCACNLVKYCGVECQKNHRKQHKKACKKRMAEIHDDRLFTQPDESHRGECPICCLPLSLDEEKIMVNSCCCQYICNGCDHAISLHEREQGLEHKCPYCREPVPETEEEHDQNYVKRAKANDPTAIFHVGKKCLGEGDYEGVFHYWKKAAALGHTDAHFNLSIMYRKGQNGVERDMKKSMYHLEEVAIGGHDTARYNLGVLEGRNGRTDRAVKHYIIAANLGDDDSLEKVKKYLQVILRAKKISKRLSVDIRLL
jgi:tetratricopeptide (TPR) repeat protein